MEIEKILYFEKILNYLIIEGIFAKDIVPSITLQQDFKTLLIWYSKIYLLTE